ncbi:hypothetical protein SZN_33096 [Streptomyces zinciresistens K42]|uniref:Uncharacterized protein n=1 Tax=Streptomyces zinciresistens K42 TaxID=700597 RepID=G2GM67_9ACTN|nr:hypothetical protein SZN_33096 [Streptomyces zinciresistens K42]
MPPAGTRGLSAQGAAEDMVTGIGLDPAAGRGTPAAKDG